MDKAEIDYKILYQRAYYTDFKEKYYTFITQYSGKNRLNSDIFFVDGYQQEYKVHTIDRLSLCFITKIPKYIRLYYMLDPKATILLCTSIIQVTRIRFRSLGISWN